VLFRSQERGQRFVELVRRLAKDFGQDNFPDFVRECIMATDGG
jgi:hypothetical protein